MLTQIIPFREFFLCLADFAPFFTRTNDKSEQRCRGGITYSNAFDFQEIKCGC